MIKSKRLIIALLIISALFGTCFAQTKNGFNPFRGTEKQVLPNGLTVITHKNNGPPVVSINFFVRAGSIDENERISGISHFCEHMFYRGTEALAGADMKMQIENMGGVFNAETSRDYTRYFVNIPSDQGLEALRIYSDALMNPQYKNDQLEQERKVILQEYNMYKDNPMALLQQRLFERAYKDHPYGRPVIGSEKTIKGLSREDLLSYRASLYTPENITIVLVGNFQTNQYISFIKKYFGSCAGSPRAKPCHSFPVPDFNCQEQIEPVPFPISNALFALAFRSPSIAEKKEVLAMDVLSFMLGKGEGSILTKRLTKESSLAREITAEYLTPRDAGLIIFYGEIPPENVEKVKESVFTALHQIKKGNFSDEDMERARNLLVKTYIFGLETNEGKADALGFYNSLGNSDFAQSYIGEIRKLQKEDLTAVANKYFDDRYILHVLKAEKPPKRN